MTVQTERTDNRLTVRPEGRLDTVSAPELEALLADAMPALSELVLDFEALTYISSAGLRVLLAAQKGMSTHGTMTVKNTNADVMEILSITGFADILTLE